jgi:hypothetical protein
MSKTRTDRSWRKTKVADLRVYGLSGSIVAKLLDAGLDTLGALADWTAQGNRLIDLPGIGEYEAERHQIDTLMRGAG